VWPPDYAGVWGRPAIQGHSKSGDVSLTWDARMPLRPTLPTSRITVEQPYATRKEPLVGR